MGLLKAAEKFNSDIGSSYVCDQIYQKLHNRRNHRLQLYDTPPRQVKEKITKIDNMYNLQETDPEKRINFIASKLQMTVKDVRNI